MVDITIKTFDGFDLDDALYKAWFPGGSTAIARESSPIVLPVIQGYPRAEGFEHTAASFQIGVALAAVTMANVDALMQAFRVGKSGPLVAEFDGEARVRDCQVEAVYPFAEAPSFVIVSLVSADPRWRAPGITADSEAVIASGQNWTLSNDGNATVDDIVYTITPTANKAKTAAWVKRRHAIVANRVKRPLSDWPIDITNGGINHAAMVTATESQADGDDLRVLADGQEIPRFLGEHANTGANSATTKVFVTHALSAMQEAHLRAAITASVPADGGELVVLRGETKSWPPKGVLVNETSGECISYDGTIETNADGYSAFQNVKRGIRGTVAAIAAADTHLLRVETKFELISGFTTVAAPEPRPDLKPLLNLASSTLTNIRHEWPAFWDDTYPTRPGGWTRSLEARDSQASFIWANRGSPAATADFLYNYYNPPSDRDQFNVLRRAFPTGTSGAAGQVALTRVVDSTLMAEIRGILADGSEHLFGALRGPLTTATFTSTFTQKIHELIMYNRSQVVVSTPEIEGSYLPDQMGSASYSQLVNAVNAAGNIYAPFNNETSDVLRVTAVEVLVWQPNTPHTNVIVTAFADDGDGSPSAFILGTVSLSSGTIQTTPTWMNVAYARAFPWAPGQTIHINVQSGSGSSSATYWGSQPMTHASAYPMGAARFKSDGEIVDYARAEGGGGILYAPGFGDNITYDDVVVLLDSASTPYFDLNAEEACYWLNGTLTNTHTLQWLRFNIFCSPNDELYVDCGARTVTNLMTGDVYTEGNGVEASDKDQWINLGSGTNEHQWDETGVVGVTIESSFYARYE